MVECINKLLLLTWKNWVLQIRRPCQLIFDILFPTLASLLLLYLRSVVKPELHEEQHYEQFCTTPIKIGSLPFLCPIILDDEAEPITTLLTSQIANIREQEIFYSPNNPEIGKVMNVFKLGFGNVEPKRDAKELQSAYKMFGENTLACVQFDDSYMNITDLKEIKNLKITIRFPGELRHAEDMDWRTDMVYPSLMKPGPRSPNKSRGALPGYQEEGFLVLQHLLTASFLIARDGFVVEGEKLDDFANIIIWLKKTEFPLIYMQRFPHSKWYEDLLMEVLKLSMGVFMIISFLCPCINIVKMITIEKEKQLKESMKIMGLPNWLHWTSWFTKNFIYMLIVVCLMLIILKTPWVSEYSIFTYSDTLILLIFFLFYTTSMITFSFVFSTLFDKVHLQMKKPTLVTKILMSLCSNSAMSFGFEVIFTYEGVGEGVHWSTLFQPTSPDDGNRLGLMIMMLILDTFIYLIVAVTVPTDSTFFEKEPSNLKVGVQIRNLRKVYGTKVAVHSLNLNIYENQITVLLGHNGAGKTTTLLMLTGMITPTSGTAIVNGYDIRHDMESVRKSMGICPQHDIIFEDLTVTEHIYFYSRLKGLTKSQTKAEITKYIAIMELKDKRHSKASKLSGGMKRKLCVCVALCGNSKVVMLDEPTSGMDPSARRALWDLLLKQKEGITILLTTQLMDEADVLGDRIAIMSQGELKCCGSSFFLKKRYGTGYLLIIDKQPGCDTNKVTALLKGYIPDIQLRSSTESEISYLLPETRVAVFEAMLQQLESQSRNLNVQSYGISLTTLEEVFIRQYNNLPKPTYTSGLRLTASQCLAMYLKRYTSMKRSWVLWLIHFFLPTAFVVLIMLPSKIIGITDLPPMPLTLNKYEAPITLVEKDNDLGENYQSYKRSLQQEGYKIEDESIVEEMLRLTRVSPNIVRKRYIVGASFNWSEMSTLDLHRMWPTINVWFNNDPYHSPAVALGVALNAVFQKNTNCSVCSIQFINHPFPFSEDTQVTNIVQGDSKGEQIALYTTFAFIFTSCFYIMFIVRENACKSKHLQFVTGTKIPIFWLVTFAFDFTTYMVVCLLTLATLACFQEDGFKTAEDLNTKNNGDGGPGSKTCDRSVALRHVTGTTLFLGICTKRVIYKLLLSKIVRENVQNMCGGGIGRKRLFEKCFWGSRGCLWNCIVGLVLFVILFLIEYDTITRPLMSLAFKCKPQYPVENDEEDDDVAEERSRIRNMTTDILTSSYEVAVNDLTKYYKKFLAVNGLCVGVKRYECFGLLGANGAGKTTTFKMMTGDVRMTYGEGWIKGYRIRNEMRKIHKVIGYCPQFDALLEDLTARETIAMFSLVKGFKRSDASTVAEKLADILDFREHLDKQVKQMSGGNKRKLSAAVALIGDPTVLFFDEPTSGMDPATKNFFKDVISKIRNQGRCIILTSHGLEECESLCTRLAIMDNGNFRCLGSVQHLKNKFAKGCTFTIKIKKEYLRLERTLVDYVWYFRERKTYDQRNGGLFFGTRKFGTDHKTQQIDKFIPERECGKQKF
nr:unnamed protein product [Callosobruchus analis]